MSAQEDVRVAEEKFHLLVDAVTDYAIFMLDDTGHVATWNSGAQRTKGYTPEEIIGQHFSIFYTPEDRAAGKPERLLETVSYEAVAGDAKTDGKGHVTVDAKYVDDHLGALVKDEDLTRYIL